MHKLWFTITLIALLSACIEGESDSSTANIMSTQVDSKDLDSEAAETQDEAPDATHAFYFSYDDSSSTAARDLSIYAIDNAIKPRSSLGRPYEFLNAESFSHFNQQQAGPFEVSMGAYDSQPQELTFPNSHNQLLALGVSVSGPALSKSQRPNVVITLLVDVSGSMGSKYASETRSDISSLLDVTKHGLLQLPNTLKLGDVVNLVAFSTDAKVVLEGWQVGQEGLTQAISGLKADHSTNLDKGIQLAYQVANRQYDSEKSNRVVILTDARANTGVINPTIISKHTVINGQEGIHFAGIGIGSDFSDAFLNELTEHGKGVYSAMITPNDAERIFTSGFTRFIDSAVTDIKFKLEYPASLLHAVSSAEEISENSDDIQSIDFAYNSDQFFFELFSPQEDFSDEYEVTLQIQYQGDDNQQETVRITHSVAELLQHGEIQIKSAAAVSTLAFLINGKIKCDDVLSSGLYLQSLDDVLFTDYQERIRQFCNL
jgi:Ca-activated chloride channel family protein